MTHADPFIRPSIPEYRPSVLSFLDSGEKIQQQTAQLERKNDAVEVAPEQGRNSPDDRFHLARETLTNEKTLSDTKTDRGASTQSNDRPCHGSVGEKSRRLAFPP